jgi:phage terminase large subunit-like protein
MLPAHSILNVTPKPGVPEGVETIYVRHISGGRSEITIKSYDSQVEAFYGARKDVIWVDEECPQGIYVECLARTLSTVPGEPNGLIIGTWTPLYGATELVRSFMEAPADSQKYVVAATWDDVPHLSAETKEQLYKEIPAYQRDARTRGIPQLGSGAVFQISDEDLLVKPFPIPDHWPRCYGMDVGWNKTAVCWLAS